MKIWKFDMKTVPNTYPSGTDTKIWKKWQLHKKKLKLELQLPELKQVSE